MRRSGTDDRFWQWSFGKRLDEELYRLDVDPACVENLADVREHAARKQTLRRRLLETLEEQADPRMRGEGERFDEYPYADESGRDFYERFMRGEDLNAGWVEPTDFEQDTLE